MGTHDANNTWLGYRDGVGSLNVNDTWVRYMDGGSTNVAKIYTDNDT